MGSNGDKVDATRNEKEKEEEKEKEKNITQFTIVVISYTRDWTHKRQCWFLRA